jgi:hypothetical protein
MLACSSFANSATYNLQFFDSPTVGNTAGDYQPSGDRNIFQNLVVGTGTLTIADSAVAPSARLSLLDDTVIGLDIEYTDTYGVDLRWTLPGAPVLTQSNYTPYALLDEEGVFLRFDIEETTTAVPGIRTPDTNTPAPPPFGAQFHPVVELHDRDNFELGYITEGFSVPNLPREWIPGDFITRSLWETLGSPVDFVRFAGTFRFEDSQKDTIGGVFLASLVEGGQIIDPGTEPPETPAYIPLPASGLLLLGGLLALAGVGRAVRVSSA